MRVVARLLWTEPVLFLSAVAAVFTLGGGVAVTLGAPPWVALVCGAVGPAISAAAKSKAWSPKAVHDLAVAKRRAGRHEPHQSAPEPPQD